MLKLASGLYGHFTIVAATAGLCARGSRLRRGRPSMRLQEGTVLSLLWWEDEQQLNDEYAERTGSRRSDGRTDWE